MNLMRFVRLALLVAIAALAVWAGFSTAGPAGESAPRPRATDAMRPKVFDFPGHNLW